MEKNKNPQNEIVHSEIQGDHGITPPEEKIICEIEEWLNSLNLECVDDRLVYGLEISGWKCFSGKIGVTLFRVRDYPFDESLELRVRVQEEKDFLWRCFLFCPTKELAWQVALCARTDAYNWISAFIHKRESLPKSQIRLKGNRSAKRDYAYSKKRDKSEHEVTRLSRGRSLKKLCWIIGKTYNDELITFGNLILLAEKEAGIKFSKDSCYDLMERLLDRGVLDPCSEEGESGYRATEILYERAFDYENILRQEEVNRLEARNENILGSEASTLKEISRLEKRLVEQKELLARISIEKNENTETIQNLRAVITGSYEGDED